MRRWRALRRLAAVRIRLVAGLVALALPAYGAAAATTEEVEIGGLAATYVAPDAARPAAGAIIIAGSGPTDRNGNSRLGLNTDAYKLLADALAERGIASVRYDKRGVGGSARLAHAEQDTTISDFAADATAVAQWLRTQRHVASVFLIGHSEGGLIALLIAERVKPAGVVLLAVPGRRLGALLREQFTRPGVRGVNAAEALSIIAALERGEAVPEVIQGLLAAFRPSVQPYLRSLIAIDPAEQVRHLSARLMIVGGGRDVQVGRTDFDALVATRSDAVAYWDPDMAHTLKPARADATSMQRAYTDPTLALAAGLADRVADFIRSAGR